MREKYKKGGMKVGNSSNSPLYLLINEEKVDECLTKIRNNDYDPNYIYQDNSDNLLIRACLKGLVPVVNALCNSRNFDINYSNAYGESAFLIACGKDLVTTISRMIEIYGIDNIDIGKPSLNGVTPFIYVCLYRNVSFADIFLKTGRANEGQQTSDGVNALMVCCDRTPEMADMAIKLIRLGTVDLSASRDNGKTALMYCIENNLLIIAEEIMKSGRDFGINKADKLGRTALLLCCNNFIFFQTAIKLIELGADPGHTDNNGSTALITIIQYKYDILINYLLNLGLRCNPSQIDINQNTALQYACSSKLANVSNKILDIPGLENIGNANYKGETALITACKNKMQTVALKIVNSGKSNPNSKDEDYHNAYYYANLNKMKQVMNALRPITDISLKFVSLGSEATNNLDGETKKIGEFINENPNVIIFKSPYSNSFEVTTREVLEMKRLEALRSICKRKPKHYGEDMDMNSMIHYVSLYFLPITGITFAKYVLFDDIVNILNSDKKVYYLEKTKHIESTAIYEWLTNKQGFYNRTGRTSFSCGDETSGDLYRIFPFDGLEPENIIEPPVVRKRKRNINDINNINNITNDDINETKEEPFVRVKVKENEIYNFVIDPTTTIGNIKNMLIEKIKENGVNRNPTIRLMMGLGKNYTSTDKDTDVIMSLPNFQDGFTFSPVMIGTQQTGGKHKYYKNNKQTYRRKRNTQKTKTMKSKKTMKTKNNRK